MMYSFVIDQTAAMDGVKLWDLRKLRNFRSFAPYDPNTPTNSGMPLLFVFHETFLISSFSLVLSNSSAHV